MGNIFDSIGTCFLCYDSGSTGWVNGEDFDTEFCTCAEGIKLENEYAEWYAESVMNEFYKENA
jgi:hypothetical protein